MIVLKLMFRALTKGGPKKRFWALSALLSRLRQLRAKENSVFRKEVIRSFFRSSIKPVSGENERRAQASVNWLLRAQMASPDNGVSMGYFPCDGQPAWRPSYPETTGYIVQTLVEFAEATGNAEIREHALEMARWEIDVQMPNGAVQGGMLAPLEKQSPVAFNTGMVLQGYTAAFRATGDQIYFEAAKRAADFLVADLDDDGHFRALGPFVVSDTLKTYNVLCAWALYRFGEDSGDASYLDAAKRNVEATIALQQPNGWFPRNCLSDPAEPYTHTIGYTLQGILEVGLLSEREDYVEAAERGVRPILDLISPKGYLSGKLDSRWKKASLSACLTGSAQLAIVLFRLGQHRGDSDFLDAANRLTDFLKATQNLESSEKGLRGAIAGSFPILGGYMTAGYPNWATKYYVDALVLQQTINRS